jgi:hypothetical protein
VSRIKRVDDSNGDHLVVEEGHAGGTGQYTFGNKNTALIAYGAFGATGAAVPVRTEIIVVDARPQ